MKRNILYLVMFAVLAILTGCENIGTENLPTALELENTVLDVPAEGGHFTVKYDLQGPREGAQLIVTPQYKWVSNVDISVPGEISFDVEKSYEESARSCKIDIAYPGVYPNPTVTVNQAEGLQHSISFNVKEVGHSYIVMDVTPFDKTMPYIFLLGYKDYIDENNFMEDDLGQIASDLETFEEFGAAMGGDAASVMAAFMYTGDLIDHTFTGVVPETEYVAYAYGFDVESMTPTTEVCRVVITTKSVDDYVVDFNFDIDIQGADVTIDIEPVGYDGPFFFDILYASDLPENASEEQIREVCSAVWEEWKNYHMSFGFEIEDVLNILAYKKSAHWEGELPYNEDYVVFAFAMNESAILNSTPELCYFSTGDVVGSDMEFDLQVTDIHARKATVSITPSTDETYVAMVATAQRYDGMTDDEIIEYICDNYSVSIAQGAFTQDVRGLRPEMKYYLLAFGYQGGKPTTELTKVEFETTAAQYAQANVSLEYDKFYDLEDVLEIVPGWGLSSSYDMVLPVDCVSDGEVEYMYAAVMLEEDFSKYKEDEIANSLFSQGELPDPFTIFYLDYNTSFVFVCMGEDANGDFTRLWSSKPANFVYEDASDAQEFVDNYIYNTNNSPAPYRSEANAEVLKSDGNLNILR